MAISKPLEDNFKASLTQQLAGSGSALIMYMSKVPVATIPVGYELVVTINPAKGFTGSVQQENVLVESIDTVNNTMTIKASGRAQSRYNGDSPTAVSHPVGSVVIISDAFPVWDALDDFLATAGGTMTGDLEWSTTTKAGLKVNSLTTVQRDALSSVSNGMVIYNTTVGEFQVRQGGGWATMASGSTQPDASTTVAGKVELPTQSENNAGTAIGGTGAALASTPAVTAVSVQNSAWVYVDSTGSSNAYAISLTPAVTTYAAGQIFTFKANFANTGAATINVNSLGAKTLKKNSNSDLAPNDIKNGEIITVGYDGTNFQVLSAIGNSFANTSGIANTTITDKYALSYNGNQRLDLADGNDANLNQEWIFAGIANGASTSGNAQNYYAPGPVVDIPTFALSDRQNCRLWDGETQATSNTTTDTISSTTAWRAQTFTPSAGQDNVSKVLINITNSSLSATMQCSIYATSGGLPTGAALASATALTTFASGDLTFDFTTPLSVTPATVYAIVVRLSAYTSGNFAWNYQSTNPYAGGQRCTSPDSGANWTADSTSDFRFKVQYRGLAGEPVYLSDTAGTLALTPGTYNKKVGNLITSSSMVLAQDGNQIFGTISASVTATGTTDSEVTLGFRPRLLYLIASVDYQEAASAYPAGFLMWCGTSMSNVMALQFSSRRGATANAALASSMDSSTPLTSIPLKAYNTTDTNTLLYTISLQSVGPNTVTIRRVITTHPAGTRTLTINFIAFT